MKMGTFLIYFFYIIGALLLIGTVEAEIHNTANIILMIVSGLYVTFVTIATVIRGIRQ